MVAQRPCERCASRPGDPASDARQENRAHRMAQGMDRPMMDEHLDAQADARVVAWCALVDHAPLPMALTVGAAHTLRCANTAFQHLLHSAPTVPRENCLRDVLWPGARASLQPLLDRVFASGVAEVAADLDARDPAPGSRSWTYTVWPVTGPNGRVDGLVVQASETTAQVRTQQRDAQTGQALRAVNEQLLLAGLREQAAHDEVAAALRVRDQFLTVASHELRTPLTSLLGYADLLQRKGTTGTLSEAQRTRMLGLVVRQAQRLRSLLEQVFDVTRIQHGQFVLDRQPIDLDALVVQVVDEFRLSLAASELAPTVTLHAAADALVVNGDAARLEQVVLNLLSNAVKYSAAGSPVAVRVERAGTEAAIEVTDQGIGIPQAARAHLFDSFYRAPNVGLVSGFGIGLHVVGEIVAGHDGRIAVESTEGQGSTFRIVLPLYAPAD